MEAASQTIEHAASMPALLVGVGLCKTTSEARRLLFQRAVKIDGEIVDQLVIECPGREILLQVGKRRWIRVEACPLHAVRGESRC